MACDTKFITKINENILNTIRKRRTMENTHVFLSDDDVATIS
jgi:hypothetical protein